MLTPFNSLLFYVFALGGSAYILGFINENQKRKTFFAFIITFAGLAIPCLIAGWRGCGTDTLEYIRAYKWITDAPWDKLFDTKTISNETGHIFLTKLLTYIQHIRFYFLVYGFLTVYPVYLVSLKFNKSNIALTMFVFYLGFFVSSLNIMRQYLALSLVVLSLPFVFEKRFRPFLLCILLASTFHLSAIISIPIYFLWTKKGRIIPALSLIVILLAVSLISINLDNILSSSFFADSDISILNRYSTYTETAGSKNRDFYLNLFTLVIILFAAKQLIEVDNRNALFITMYVISVILGLSGFISPFAKRISYYYAISEIWLLPSLPKVFTNRRAVWTVRVLVLIYAVARFTVIAYVLDYSDLIPYYWILPSWSRF